MSDDRPKDASLLSKNKGGDDGCCPPGSIGHSPSVSTADHPHRGELLQLAGLKAYVASPTTGADARCAIIVGHDSFGIDSGRTRQLSDELAEIGVIVLCPDFWRYLDEDGVDRGAGATELVSRATDKGGTAWDKLAGLASAPRFLYGISRLTWDRVREDLRESVWPFLRERGVTRIAAVGFCWGGWLVCHACGEREWEATMTSEEATNDGGESDSPPIEVCCGVGMHPALNVCRLQNEDQREVMSRVRCPLMMLSARNDPAPVRPGGMASKVLADKAFADDCFFETFPDMYHGWVNRGDVDGNPLVKRDVERAMDLAKGFLGRHLLQDTNT